MIFKTKKIRLLCLLNVAVVFVFEVVVVVVTMRAIAIPIRAIERIVRNTQNFEHFKANLLK